MTDIIDVPFISLRIKIFLTPIFQNWTHLKVFFFDDGYQRFFIYFITHKNISNTLSENVFFKGTNQTLIFVFFKITHLFFKVGRKTIKLIFQLEKNSASNSFCIHQKVTFFCKKTSLAGPHLRHYLPLFHKLPFVYLIWNAYSWWLSRLFLKWWIKIPS